MSVETVIEVKYRGIFFLGNSGRRKRGSEVSKSSLQNFKERSFFHATQIELLVGV